MAGYSGIPLVKKLGFKEGFLYSVINPPKNFADELQPLPNGTKLSRGGTDLDLVLIFAKSLRDLQKRLAIAMGQIKPNGMIWVAWPKKNSGVATELAFDIVQRCGLDAGLVDVKICAVNDVWSGLKFVYRVKDRARVARG
jgi:hypothetical protein